MRDALGRLVDAYDGQHAGAIDAAFATWKATSGHYLRGSYIPFQFGYRAGFSAGSDAANNGHKDAGIAYTFENNQTRESRVVVVGDAAFDSPGRSNLP